MAIVFSLNLDNALALDQLLDDFTVILVEGASAISRSQPEPSGEGPAKSGAESCWLYAFHATLCHRRPHLFHLFDSFHTNVPS